MKHLRVGILGVLAVVMAGCSVKSADEQAAGPTGTAGSTQAQAEPALTAIKAVAPAAPTPGRIIPVNTQGAAPVGLTVRVKNIELGADATIIDISASYGGTNSNDVDLAFSDTFLRDEQGNKLMLKRISGNKDLKIRAGEQMDGRLVFLGAVPAGTKSVTLVLNDGNDGMAITGPGLNIPIDLKGAAR